MLQFFRPRYMLSLPVLMQFTRMLDQRNALVFALTFLRAAKTTPQLVRQCQKTLNDISTRYTVGLYWVPGHVAVRGNEFTDKLARGMFCSKVC
jgi:ribonuclease HI